MSAGSRAAQRPCWVTNPRHQRRSLLPEPARRRWPAHFWAAPVCPAGACAPVPMPGRDHQLAVAATGVSLSMETGSSLAHRLLPGNAALQASRHPPLYFTFPMHTPFSLPTLVCAPFGTGPGHHQNLEQDGQAIGLLPWRTSASPGSSGSVPGGLAMLRTAQLSLTRQ